ncbi:hypothetical protein POM88_009820 [Heracleum sosnowskyi]|uniref:Uncharacterized protein n=1 Tax=Heracleum sosnowskyi TaxID=360622 RepID=A0AAD8JCL7_9APIA|nr:hypothetical protein POM88_009820 [Heracleum sosnowskyi]
MEFSVQGNYNGISNKRTKLLRETKVRSLIGAPINCTLYATARRVLCKTWEMNDRLFGSLQVLEGRASIELPRARHIKASPHVNLKEEKSIKKHEAHFLTKDDLHERILFKFRENLDVEDMKFLEEAFVLAGVKDLDLAYEDVMFRAIFSLHEALEEVVTTVSQKSAVLVKNVVYQNITGTSATDVAIKFDCSQSHPCE